MKPIDGEQLEEIIYKYYCKSCREKGLDRCRGCKVTNILGFMKKLCGKVEAKPVVHAHWISEDEAEELGHLEWSYGCSNCKEIFWDCTESFAFSYCPFCGAQMDEGVKIPVISMEDVPKIAKEMEK